MFHLQQIDRDPNVLTYRVEPLSIPYTFCGRVRGYVPDLLVEYSDGTRVLVEVKPSARIHEDVVQAKAHVGRHWASSNGATFAFWSADSFAAQEWLKGLFKLLKRDPNVFPNSWNKQRGVVDADTLCRLIPHDLVAREAVAEHVAR